MAATLRLDPALDAELGDYCERVGAMKSRVIALALRSYLGHREPPLHLAPPDEPGKTALADLERAEQALVAELVETFDAVIVEEP